MTSIGVPASDSSVTGELRRGPRESEKPADRLADPRTGGRPRTNRDWWPNQLDLSVLHAHSSQGNPLRADFRYADAFRNLDIEALKRDITEVLTTSQEWWPADFGHYGGLIIRLSWHAAGTYRIHDGRGGAGRGMNDGGTPDGGSEVPPSVPASTRGSPECLGGRVQPPPTRPR